MEPTYFRWGSYGNEVVECGMDKATHVYLTRADFDALVAQRDGTTARDDAVEEAAKEALVETALAWIKEWDGADAMKSMRLARDLVAAAEKYAALRREKGGDK